MSEELLVRHCAPTLAGLKTGSLFSCPMEAKQQFLAEIRRLNRALVPKGFRVVPLRCSRQRALIYLFRPNDLKRDFTDLETERLLLAAGYPAGNVGRCVAMLMHKLSNNLDFPHEIGLFLGYPPEDVRGFIENRAGNFKCLGCWKVYGDEEKAKRRFLQFEQCKNRYCRQFHSGVSIDRLAVTN